MGKAELENTSELCFFHHVFLTSELTFRLTLEEKETVFTFKFWLRAYG